MCIGVAAVDFKKSTCSLVQISVISVNSSLVDFLPVCASTLKTLQVNNTTYSMGLCSCNLCLIL